MALRTRRIEPEIMDRPNLATDLHLEALQGLERINRISGTARRYWPEVERLARKMAPRPVRLLDVACGGGDVAIELVTRANRLGVALDVHGCDSSAVALARARELSKRTRRSVRFFKTDVLLGLPDRYDVMVCSLFLHHLTDEEAVEFLGHLAAATHRLMLVSDLVRGRLGYALAYLASRSLTRSSVVRVDALRSVTAAFTLTEAARLAREAGLSGVRIERCFPQRFLLTWKRP